MTQAKTAGSPFSRIARGLTALLATLAIAVALWQLMSAPQGLQITHERVEGVPITVFNPVTTEPRPVAVIAHGFTGSRQMMQPLAITLARQGYLAITLDFPGHGANPKPFVPDIMDLERRRQLLGGALEHVVDHARAHPASDGRITLMGHSMAGDIMLNHGQQHPGQVRSMVLISPFIAEDTRMEGLDNLLFIFGELEPAALREPALPAFEPHDTAQVQPGMTYGDFTQGHARRLVIAEGAEHMGIIHARQTLLEALAWMEGVDPSELDAPFVDARGPWLGLLFLGIIALAWPLMRALPRVTDPPRGSDMPWRPLWPVAVVPAVLTPLLLWQVPLGGLPLLLSDYLTMHFAVYGLLTWVGLWLLQRRRGNVFGPFPGRTAWGALLVAVCLATTYGTLAVGLPIHAFVTGYLPIPERLVWLPVIFLGTLLFFSADEWLTRGETGTTGAYFFTKMLFLLSLVGAVGLRLEELFFLIIIFPAIAVFLLVYGLLARWTFTATGHPLVGAIAVAFSLAWGMSVTFPLVGD
ncbi:alpha/beta hydrolase [Ectothiorhodospira marina]|jgi:pimeloyl-ACP methyl ester carboxylesterase|uniref:Serine aminopeptidase, S33 n=1 Tax=Ectothiorhodospira marina TaxID=1396821 RepID=A0A1H7MQJ1_9GAMM|nr:alpha/beta fold hydrolase [Ectothiorhodospira marina]SEL13596.1 Serine aminopeptidase, S33 [Ectothiorhodospira marina]